MENKILETDRKLINSLFGLDPVQWSRRENGELVYLNAQGQKFVYTPEKIQKLIDKKLEEKVQSVSQGRNAEIPIVRLSQVNSVKGNRTHAKAKTKELIGEQAPNDAP